MSEGKHTPGPWVILPEECDKPYIRIRGSVLGGRYKIANVLTPVYDGVHEREVLETRANARLIAAAPDLLAVLEHISRCIPSGGFAQIHWDSSTAAQIEEAIAKAKGTE